MFLSLGAFVSVLCMYVNIPATPEFLFLMQELFFTKKKKTKAACGFSRFESNMSLVGGIREDFHTKNNKKAQV